eukprot:snap_masked-scaffold_5-processed-gene-1.37-mRNA-1 protein AED:1.00 eAED:1.00 QI:0/-1/0/0/-1/1/1/0/341
MIRTLEQLKAALTAVPLHNIDLQSFDSGAQQPNHTPHHDELKDHFTSLLESHVNEANTEKEVSFLREKFEKNYGGSTRFYDRFLIARDHKMEKSKEMMGKMLQGRVDVLGPDLLSSVALTENHQSKGKDLEEEELFSKIQDFWPIKFYGFSALTRFHDETKEKEANHRGLLQVAKLRDIQPKKFVEEFSEVEIKRFYYHFMETGNHLITASNQVEFGEFDDDHPTGRRKEKGRGRKGITEIYDFEGLSTSVFSSPKGIMTLKNVLSVGSITYPEHVEKTVFLNAPYALRFIWKGISVVLDKETKKKISFPSQSEGEQWLIEMFGTKEAVDEMWKSFEEKGE